VAGVVLAEVPAVLVTVVPGVVETTVVVGTVPDVALVAGVVVAVLPAVVVPTVADD
jgi:hypothetical protein